QHGQAVRLKGKGVPHLNSSGRGDQLVYLDVVIPRTLTKDQKTLYQKLHAASGIPEQSEDDRGVFDRIKDALFYFTPGAPGRSRRKRYRAHSLARDRGPGPRGGGRSG